MCFLILKYIVESKWILAAVDSWKKASVILSLFDWNDLFSLSYCFWMYKRNTLNVLHRQSKFNTPKMDGAENWWVLLFLQITLASREKVCLACFPCLFLTKWDHNQFTQICYGGDSGRCRYQNSTFLKREDIGFWFVSALKLLPGRMFVSLSFCWSLEMTTISQNIFPP